MPTVQILHCADCNNPLMITTGRGSFCPHCNFTPSMQDTYFKTMNLSTEVEVPSMHEVLDMRQRFTVGFIRENYAHTAAMVHKLLDAVERLKNGGK